MRNIKLVMLPTLVMLALLMTGFAYAHWSQNLYIVGNVDSGVLDWQFTFASAMDEVGNDWNCGDNFAPDPWRVDKDVGSTTIAITDPHTVTMTLTNVYPSYWTSASIYARNTGTIPLVIENAIVDGVVVTHWDMKVRLDLNDDGKNDIEIWWKANIFGLQLEPGDPTPETGFWVHVLQDAPQGETLEFTIGIVAVQWNA